MPPRPKGMSDKYSPARRAELFSFLANNDGNKSKASRELGIPRNTVTELVKRYAHEVKEQKAAVREALIAQAIDDRTLAMDVLREALKTQLEMLRDPKTARFVRPSDIARSMKMLDEMIRLEGVNGDAGSTPDSEARDESEVDRKIDAFLESESAEDSKG